MKLLSRTWGYMDMPCTDPSMVFMPTWDRVLQASLEEDCRYKGPPQQDGKLPFLVLLAFDFHLLP